MWTELKYCRKGDYIKAYFLGDSDVPNGGHWHEIFEIEEKPNGKYYAAIEDFRGGELRGIEDVYRKD